MKYLFFTQIFGMIFAAVIFQIGLDPRVAGLIAGLVFVTVGIYGVRVSLFQHWNRRLRIAVGILALIHVLGIALPMLGFRIQSWNEPFSSVAVWGLSGPTFHALSTRFYSVWMILTAIAWGLERKKDPSGSSLRK